MDVLDRYVDEEGRFYILRFVGLEGFLFFWVCNMIGVNNFCYVYEYFVVDLVKKTMVMGSRNMILFGFVDVEEILIYF